MATNENEAEPILAKETFCVCNTTLAVTNVAGGPPTNVDSARLSRRPLTAATRASPAAGDIGAADVVELSSMEERIVAKAA